MNFALLYGIVIPNPLIQTLLSIPSKPRRDVACNVSTKGGANLGFGISHTFRTKCSYYSILVKSFDLVR